MSLRGKFETLKQYASAFGLKLAVYNCLQLRGSKLGDLISHRLPGAKAPLFLRARTSDLWAFGQIFLEKDYEINLRKPPGLIIDGGANIGCASVYFANRFPSARIVAVEPDRNNVAVLERNLNPYPRSSIIRAGLWSKKTRLRIENPVDSPWAFRVREDEETKDGIDAVTIGGILESTQEEFIDILKLDIEGAEKEVFSSCDAWIDRVGMIIIELHDRFMPGCSEALFSAIGRSKHRFVESIRGENLILTRVD